MATINENGILINSVSDGRVFLRSEAINVFPCSRRGQEHTVADSFKYYDPEARLNTERTNRLHTAINGFKSSFIISTAFEAGDTLKFVLAGYYIEVKNFYPSIIASAFSPEDTATLYAHLRLHTNVSLGVEGYFTEMLYRQSNSEDDRNYLDVSYVDGERSGDFFVGVSFTKELIDDDDPSVYNLPLFSYVDGVWELVQSSLLPKIDHDRTADSVKVIGNFTSDGKIKAKEHIEAPALSVDTITSKQENGTITIESPVVIEDTTVLNNGLEVAAGETRVQRFTASGSASVQELTASDVSVDSLFVDGDIGANGTVTAEKLVISGTEVDTPRLSVEHITSKSGVVYVANKDLVVHDLKADSVKVRGAGGKIEAKEVAAKTITQNGNQVPVISIEQIGTTSEVWQLQITNVIKNQN